MPTRVVAARRAHGQLIPCVGCCCGRTDRGRPEVPVGRLKEAWKRRRLGRTIQLTISGCVGPCDVANVAVLVTSEATAWFGGFAGDGDYDLLARWAEACHAAGAIVPNPDELERHRFDYLVPTPHVSRGRDRTLGDIESIRNCPKSEGGDCDG